VVPSLPCACITRSEPTQPPQQQQQQRLLQPVLDAGLKVQQLVQVVLVAMVVSSRISADAIQFQIRYWFTCQCTLAQVLDDNDGVLFTCCPAVPRCY
jgi:hypothetical protein